MELETKCGIRLNQLDKLRTLCAFLIVLIHVESPFSVYYIPVTRCAVPIFLILSGFLMAHKKNNQIKRSIYTILRYVIVATVVFSIVKLGVSIIKEDWEWISVKAVSEFILLNDNPFATHLWYLTAYLYVLIIFYFLVKKNIDIVKLWPLVPFLLIGNLFLGNYSCLFFDADINCNLSRNFLFIGLPYFLMGVIINEKQKYLPKNANAYAITIIIASISSCFEDCWLNTINIQHVDDHFFSTPFLAVSLFLLFYSLKNNENITSRIGRSYSLYIYLYHPLVVFIYILIKTYARIPEELFAWYSYVHPIVVFGLTTMGIHLVFKSRSIVYGWK